jgi:hypothetical protein
MCFWGHYREVLLGERTLEAATQAVAFFTTDFTDFLDYTDGGADAWERDSLCALGETGGDL